MQSLPKINVEDVFIAGIITLYPDMTPSAIGRLWEQLADTSWVEEIWHNYHPSFLLCVRDLYSQIVGELGISPAIFFQMSPEECELAYQGYLRRQALAANLNKLAYMQAMAGITDEISLTSASEFNGGSQLEREQTFSVLGIDVNDNI